MTITVAQALKFSHAWLRKFRLSARSGEAIFALHLGAERAESSDPLAVNGFQAPGCSFGGSGAHLAARAHLTAAVRPVTWGRSLLCIQSVRET